MYTKKTLQISLKDLQSRTMFRYAMKIFIALVMWTFCNKAFAQATVAPVSDFQEAMAAYKKQDFDSAKLLLTKFLQNTPSSEAYFDLGLVEFETKHTGAAVANWRKALQLDPQNQMALDSLHSVLKKLDHPELNRQSDSFEIFREQFLNQVKIEYLFLLTALLFVLDSWLFISYLGERKRSREQELAAPRPAWLAGIILIFFMLSLGLSGAKIYDLSQARATVLPTKIEVLSAPDPSSTSLFDLFEGLEVIVQEAQGEFYQVSFPGGMTGWTLKKNLMITAGSEP